MTINTSERQFLDLLRLGLDNIDIPESLKEKIDWNSIYKNAKRQTLLGIIYDAINKLPASSRPAGELAIKWYGQTILINRLNNNINSNIKEVVGTYKKAGLNIVLLKGQGLAQYYPNPMSRHPGDIDLYFFDGYDKANEIAATLDGVEFLPDTSYHRAYFYKGIEVENHLVYVDFYSKRNRKAWNEIVSRIPLTSDECLQLDGFNVKIPQPQINVLYVFLHSMHHMLQVGIGLRQICDWVCLWRKKHKEIDKELFHYCIKRLKIERSITAMAYVAEEYLGLEKGIIPLDTSTKRAIKDGNMIIRDILDSGNFGHDTKIMDGFERNKHIKNLKAYFLAVIRQLKLLRLYPSEVIAYPFEWLKQKINGEE
ncbi:MAG: nucleotidyltransferase family protein [Bacteroidaceae bacterium]|nr:nucleotidyltransferase family protein [Bacteroidaceae bacterium]